MAQIKICELPDTIVMHYTVRRITIVEAVVVPQRFVDEHYCIERDDSVVDEWAYEVGIGWKIIETRR